MASIFNPGDIIEPTAFVSFLTSNLTEDSTTASGVKTYLTQARQTTSFAVAPMTVNSTGNFVAPQPDGTTISLSYINWTDAAKNTVQAYFPAGTVGNINSDQLRDNCFQLFTISNATTKPIFSPSLLVINNSGSLINKGKLLRITNSFTLDGGTQVPSVVTTDSTAATTGRCSGVALCDIPASGGLGVMLIDGVTTALGLDTSAANEQDPVFVNGVAGQSSLAAGATVIVCGHVVGISPALGSGAVWVHGIPNVSSTTVN